MERALVAGEDGKWDPIVDAGNQILRWFDQRSPVLTPNLSKCYWGKKNLRKPAILYLMIVGKIDIFWKGGAWANKNMQIL